ncbi:MAG: dienelactone hydrolase family protein [Planctomycetales bacterium]|nr:dienelactone hydrolase family protein [Planctomycetales bacterium]
MAVVDFQEKLLECLGGPWPEACPLAAKTHETISQDGYRIERVTYEVEPGDVVGALLLIPANTTADRPAPGICVWHQHNGQWHLGKSEPAGLAGAAMHHTGAALAREGFVVLCPDALGFEDRQKPYRLQGRDLERYLFLDYTLRGKCMAWKNILDMRRAVDYLVTRPEVAADKLGCYGHSMGSTHAWLVGPWEPRLKALVGNCCLPTYQAIHDAQMLHCFPNFVPGVWQYGDTPDIAALIAPRALHLNFGEKDGGSPIEYVREGVKTIARTYESMHAEDKFTYFIEAGAGHVLSDSMWRKTLAFFGKHLRAG